ncbi:MAG: S8 family peptidase [Candidatus Shapirobacteria bacterium]
MLSKILVPRNTAKRSVPFGRDDFMEKFWLGFNEPEKYESKKKLISEKIQSLTSKVKDDHWLYAEIKLNDDSNTKSKQPSLVWSQSGLDIVSAVDSQNYIIGGKKNDFERLDKIISSSKFSIAKTGDGVSKKTKNLYREIYTISDFTDKNTSYTGRVDAQIEELISKKEFETDLLCILEINSNINRSEYEDIYLQINSFVGDKKIKKLPIELFIHNMQYQGAFKVKEIFGLLTDIRYSYISRIKIMPSYSCQNCIPNYDLGEIKILPPETNEIIGIIDSGIDDKSKIFNSLKFLHLNRTPDDKKCNKNHGTFVASRILFGDKIFNSVHNGYLAPSAKFLDIQVLYDNNQGDGDTDVDTVQLKTVIDEVINKYEDIHIYNLSINDKEGIRYDIMPVDDLSEFIDERVREKDIIFVVSSGNHKFYPSGDYKKNPDDYYKIFSDNTTDTHIASPGDALNVITVGSNSLNADNNCICKVQGYPSPFTRKGGLRGGWKKPELVMDGGNILAPNNPADFSDDAFSEVSNNKCGVEGITLGGKLSKQCGSSFSTPLVTRQCAYLLDNIKKTNASSLLKLNGNRINLVKALMIHSTNKIPQAKIDDKDLKLAYGFGVPDIGTLLRDDENQVSIVYSDILEYDKKIHKLQIKIPDELVGGSAEFIFTLVYNPPVNKNYPSEYNMTSINSNLRFVLPPKLNTKTNKFVQNYSPLINKWSWENYRKKFFNVINFKNIKQKIPSTLIEVYAQLSVSPFYLQEKLGHEKEILQPYTFVLTIRDVLKRNILRNELLLSNQFNKIEISQQVKIKTEINTK